MRKIIQRGFSGTTNSEPSARELEHAKLVRRAAAESFVLLKNEGMLPVSKDVPLALYGRGAAYTIKGGTGSGDVNERESISIYSGLVNLGYTITTKEWLDNYTKEFSGLREEWKQTILKKVNEEKQDFFNVYSTTPFLTPAGDMPQKTDTDTAIYVLSRVAGEGADRFLDKGDYYLTDKEYETIKEICRLYDKVLLVINSGSVVDLCFLDEEWAGSVKAVMYISQPGMEGGNAFADVISGQISPSGKLTDTWPVKYEDIPNGMDFSHLNNDVSTEKYSEGIYVGYRYFDSFNVPVRYGFGYGLSYTNFDIELKDIAISNINKSEADVDMHRVDPLENVLKLEACVKNVGEHSGKEVVQVYVSLPTGKLDKEYRRLATFGKTSELKPGETELLDMNVSLYDLSSFDEASASYVLEKGVYGIWIGNSLESAVLSGSITVETDETFIELDHICLLKEELVELCQNEEDTLARYNADCDEISSKGLMNVTLEAGSIISKKAEYSDDLYSAAGRENDPVLKEAEKFVSKLPLDDVILLAMGDPLRQHNGQLGAAGSTVPGSAGETNHVARDKGLAGIPLADGPAGLRIIKHYNVSDGKVQYIPFLAALENGFFNDEEIRPGDTYYQYCTAVPVGTGLAQTWNVELVAEIGRCVGIEMEEFGITLWLAPGMNIHRNPLCGRNFEYYSEDPFISGKIASAMTKGVQSLPGIGTTIKHFCCNNVEDNRLHINSVVSEKALREIYLRGFEMAIKESQPMSIMTSYNKVNNVHSANNHDLCMKAARNEWGFAGTIMTDWTTTHDNPESTASGCMRAGNDLIMPGELSDVDNIKAEIENGTLTEADLRKCIARLVCTIFKSNQYEDAKCYYETL